MQSYILSFIYGAAYKLYENMKQTDGLIESLPSTLQDFIYMVGPSLFTYLSAKNGNIPITLLFGAILEKYIKSPFPEIAHESHKQEVYILNQLLQKARSYIKTNGSHPSQPIPYTPHVKKFFEKYGNCTINSIQIRKRPIESIYEKLLSLGSFGKWDECKKNANFNEIYHIVLILGFKDESNQYYVLVERRETINVYMKFNNSPDYMYYNVPLTQDISSAPLTIHQFFENGVKAADGSFYAYDIFANNCQHFVSALIKGNGLETADAEAFMNQRIDTFQEKMPAHVMPVLNNLMNVPLMFLIIITCLTYSYSSLNIVSLFSNVLYFLIPFITYKTLFPEAVSLPKIIASCIFWVILLSTALYNFIFRKSYVYNEFILFALGYFTFSIGNMMAQFTKDVIEEYVQSSS